MKTEEVLQQLGDLKTEAEGHYTDDGDDEVFHKDAEALQLLLMPLSPMQKSLRL